MSADSGSRVPLHRGRAVSGASDLPAVPAVPSTASSGADVEGEEHRALEREIDAAVRVVWDYHHVGHAVADDPEFLLAVDGILVFCSSDVSVADFAADLWIRTADLHDGAAANRWGSVAHSGDSGTNSSESCEKCSSATTVGSSSHDGDGMLPAAAAAEPPPLPYLLFSGGMGTGPHSGANLLGWTEPEADVLSERARARVDALRPDLTRRLRLLVERHARNSGENAALSRALIAAEGLPPPSTLALVQKPFMERRTFATVRRQWPEPTVRVCSAPVTLEEYPDRARMPIDDIVGIMLGDLQRIILCVRACVRVLRACVPLLCWSP
jgi:hypothetical protein